MFVSVSKRVLLYALGLLVLIYFVLQYLIHLNVSSALSPNEKDVSGEDGRSAHQAILLFMEVCHQRGLPVFIIDRQILVALNQNESDRLTHSSWCKYLCTDYPVTTFGIVSNLWRQTAEVTNDFGHCGFSITTLNYTEDLVPKSINVAKTIPVHFLVSHKNGHVIHLVIFYQRGDNRYMWHGKLIPQHLGRSRLVAILNNTVTVGTNEGVYDRFDLIKVRLDGIKVRVPKQATNFLMEMSVSRFLECDYRRAQLFHGKYGEREQNEEAELFYKAARDILVKAKLVLDSMGVRFWLSSGTCLGWLRQCDLIPYSKDVDIGIWIKDYKEDIIQMFQENGLTLVHQFGRVEDSYELSFVDDSVKLDIFFFYEEASYMWNGGTQAKTGKKFKYKFPPFTLCWTEFLRLKVRVPCDGVSYIEANYGTNWLEPVKSWDWKKSPSNVEPNGEWSIAERSAVIRQFI